MQGADGTFIIIAKVFAADYYFSIACRIYCEFSTHYFYERIYFRIELDPTDFERSGGGRVGIFVAD